MLNLRCQVVSWMQSFEAELPLYLSSSVSVSTGAFGTSIALIMCIVPYTNFF